MREMARIREKSLHDKASALANAKNEGLKEGRIERIAIGEANKEASLIANMWAIGMSEEQINTVLTGKK